jgi:hypothetical protein
MRQRLLPIAGALAIGAFAVVADACADDQAPQSQAQAPLDADGPYRTLCVRLCDGYYFPVRTYAKREHFAADAHTCKTSCRSPAELYTHPTFGGAPSTMVDLAGRKYAELPSAFLFKTEIKPDCTCKPPAWSEEALARHRSYTQHPIAAAAPAVAAGPSATQPTYEPEILAVAPPAAIDVVEAPVEPIYPSQRARERAMRRRAAIETPPQRTPRSFRLIQRHVAQPPDGEFFAVH